jgi:hypothetical protein
MLQFVRRKLEHEVSGKAVGIALDCLDERASLDALERSQVPIEHYALCTDYMYPIND